MRVGSVLDPIIAEVQGVIEYGDIIEGVTMQVRVDEITGHSSMVIQESRDPDARPRIVLKNEDGDYLWQPSLDAKLPPTLLGYPVTECEEMPDIAAGSMALAFGDFERGYLVVDRAGINVLRDPFTAKPYVLFYTTKRVGGGVQDFNAIKLLKFAAS